MTGDPTIFSQPTDQGALTLARAIALQESSTNGNNTPNYNAIGDGGSSYGAYQWNNGKQPLQPGQLPVNFVNAAKQYGLDPTDFSPTNQDKVAYAQVKTLKDQGLSPEQIAASWNAGMGHINDWQNHVGTTVINGQQISYDTPKYVQNVQNYYQQLSGNNQNLPQTQTQENQPTESPSVGGFLGNVVQSGANFVGNVGEALLHPINTIQNIGGMAVGGIQELGGQTNENTQKFDNLVSFFKNRYGSMDKLLHTAYTDPVGLAADISAASGIGGGLLGIGAKGAELSDLGTVAKAATEAAPAVEATGVAGKIGTLSNMLGNVSEYTNPLTPLIKGAGALINKTSNISDIIKNPGNYTPEDIANSSSAKIASDVQDAFNVQRDALSETGSAYKAIKNSAQFTEVAPDALAKLIERNSDATVNSDGIVEAGGKIIEPQQVKALQNLYDVFQPKFSSGELTASEFLQLRDYVNNKLAHFGGQVVKDNVLSGIGKGIYSDLKKLYRPNIQGLPELDAEYSTKLNKINELEDGLVYKTGNNKGEIKSTFVTRAAKALKTGNTDELNQLEQVVPGITKRLQVMKTLQDLSHPSFTTSLLEKGGILGGLATGNLQVVAAALSTIILQNPDTAVPLLRAVGASVPLVKTVMANLSKAATISVAGNNAISTPQNQLATQTETSPQVNIQSLQQPETQNLNGNLPSNDTTINQADLQALVKSKDFNLKKAKKDGYTDSEIYNYLISLK